MIKKRNFLYIGLCVLAVFLFIGRFQMIIAALLAIVLAWMMLRERSATLRLDSLTRVYIAMTVLCIGYFFLLYFTNFSVLGSASYTIKELARCVIYLLITQILMRMTVGDRFYIRLWQVILAVVVIVAVLQFTKIVDINTPLERFYGQSLQFYAAQEEGLSSFRCGSVFVNPNVFACFLVAVLGVYLVISHEVKVRLLDNVVVYALCIIGIILSGSRTGFVLCLVLMLYALIAESKNDRKYAWKFLASLALGLTMLIAVLQICGVDIISELSNLRMFKFREGVSNSFSIKLDIIKNLIETMHTGNLLFGYGPFDYAMSPNLLVDFDLGYFLVYYGMVGFALYAALIRGILRYKNSSKSRVQMFALITVIFGFTAGAYFNLRIFSIYLLLFLPMLSKSKATEET